MKKLLFLTIAICLFIAGCADKRTEAVAVALDGKDGKTTTTAQQTTISTKITDYRFLDCKRVENTNVFEKPYSNGVSFFNTPNCTMDSKIFDLEKDDVYWIADYILATCKNGYLRTITFTSGNGNPQLPPPVTPKPPTAPAPE